DAQQERASGMETPVEDNGGHDPTVARPVAGQSAVWRRHDPPPAATWLQRYRAQALPGRTKINATSRQSFLVIPILHLVPRARFVGWRQHDLGGLARHFHNRAEIQAVGVNEPSVTIVEITPQLAAHTAIRLCRVDGDALGAV